MIPIRRHNLVSLAKKHYDALENYISSPNNSFSIEAFDAIIQKYLPRENFESIIKASHQKLEAIAGIIGKRDIDEFEIFLKLFLQLNKENELFTVNEGKKSPYNFHIILEDLQVNVCPYTNRYFVEKHDEEYYLFEPFFSMHNYSYLCLSFFNLIPCSKESQKLRQGKRLGVSPYDTDFPFKDIKFSFKLNNSKWIYDKDAINLNWDLTLLDEEDKEAFEQNIRIYKLNELYKMHTSIVQEELQKLFLEPPSYLDSLFSKYSNKVFPSRSEMNPEELRTQSYNDHLQQPLSKLHEDLSKLLKD